MAKLPTKLDTMLTSLRGLGGPKFLSPLHASRALPPLLALLSPADSTPQIILQTLRTLNHIADSLRLSKPEDATVDGGLLGILYTEQSLLNLFELITDPSSSLVVYRQITLVASLLSKTCLEERHRDLLLEYRILNALVLHLNTWITDTLISSYSGIRISDVRQRLPDDNPALARARLSTLLHAIGAIVQHSRPRAYRLLHASPLKDMFQKISDKARTAFENRTINLPPNQRYRATMPDINVENLLPSIVNPYPRTVLTSSVGFPPLDAIKNTERSWSKSLSTAIEIFSSNSLEHVGDDESPLVPWLMYVVRTFDEVTGLMAAWLLAILYRLRLVKKTREASIALLVTPPLVRLLDRDLKLSQEAFHTLDACTPSSIYDIIKEEAPAVLAMLTVNSPKTQKAAVDAGVIKKLSRLLKDSYDLNDANSYMTMWSSDSLGTNGTSKVEDKSSAMGPSGLPPAVYHTTKVRETTLIALAALASDKDEYRKAIIDNGVIPFVIRTLRGEDIKVAAQSNPATVNVEAIEQKIVYGNCKQAILAACGATRALSRSVSTLRTSLMDAGLAAPLFVLLKCQDMELKIAATAVICNLVLEYSPMREVSLSKSWVGQPQVTSFQAVLDGGILRILCDHAHSINANLRLNSLWALKHLVVNAATGIRISCLEELGVNWLKQVINSDPESFTAPRTSDRDEGNGTPIRMSTPNAAGEQVDLLNAVDDGSRETSQTPEEDGDEDLKMSDSVGSLSKSDGDIRPQFIHTKSRSTLSPQASRTSSSQGQDLPDEIAIVKQGIEFIRNLILGPNNSEMIDHVFREIGQDEFFRILTSKMRPKVLNAFNRDRKSSETNGIRHIQPSAEILISTLYVVIHIAAGHPRHRQILISQPKLLELIVPLFSHSNQEIRACCAWIVYNLTWEDDASDKPGCRERARRLMDLGFYQKLKDLEEKDPDLNCKERAKTALHTLTKALQMS